jgi:hypothetical protein
LNIAVYVQSPLDKRTSGDEIFTVKRDDIVDIIFLNNGYSFKESIIALIARLLPYKARFTVDAEKLGITSGKSMCPKHIVQKSDHDVWAYGPVYEKLKCCPMCAEVTKKIWIEQVKLDLSLIFDTTDGWEYNSFIPGYGNVLFYHAKKKICVITEDNGNLSKLEDMEINIGITPDLPIHLINQFIQLPLAIKVMR